MPQHLLQQIICNAASDAAASAAASARPAAAEATRGWRATPKKGSLKTVRVDSRVAFIQPQQQLQKLQLLQHWQQGAGDRQRFYGNIWQGPLRCMYGKRQVRTPTKEERQQEAVAFVLTKEILRREQQGLQTGPFASAAATAAPVASQMQQQQAAKPFEGLPHPWQPLQQQRVYPRSTQRALRSSGINRGSCCSSNDRSSCNSPSSQQAAIWIGSRTPATFVSGAATTMATPAAETAVTVPTPTAVATLTGRQSESATQVKGQLNTTSSSFDEAAQTRGADAAAAAAAVGANEAAAAASEKHCAHKRDSVRGYSSQRRLLQLAICCRATAAALLLRLQHTAAVAAAAGLLVQVTRRSTPPPMPLQRLTLGFADAAIEE